MKSKELCQAIADKLWDMHMCLLTWKDDLPDTYLSDMKDMFNANPEADTASNVAWTLDFEGYYSGGVITLINCTDKDAVCEKLVKYAKEKNISEMHLLYGDENGQHMEMTYDNSKDGFYPGTDVILWDDGTCYDGSLNICLNDWQIGL